MKKIAVLLENNFEESELLYPYHRLREDYDVVLVGTEADTGYVGKSGGQKLNQIYQALMLRQVNLEASIYQVGFTGWYETMPSNSRLCKRSTRSRQKIAAICHALWVLVEADILKGVKATSVKAVSTDVKNAGANWVDEEIVVDNNIITARSPKDLPVHVKTFVEELEK